MGQYDGLTGRLATKSDNLSSIPLTHLVEGKIPVCFHLHMHCPHTQIINEKKLNIQEKHIYKHEIYCI